MSRPVSPDSSRPCASASGNATLEALCPCRTRISSETPGMRRTLSARPPPGKHETRHWSVDGPTGWPPPLPPPPPLLLPVAVLAAVSRRCGRCCVPSPPFRSAPPPVGLARRGGAPAQMVAAGTVIRHSCWVPPLLTQDEYQGTIGPNPARVASDEEPPFDFWPYFDSIAEDDFGGHDFSEGRISYAWQMPGGVYQHVLVDCETPDVFWCWCSTCRAPRSTATTCWICTASTDWPDRAVWRAEPSAAVPSRASPLIPERKCVAVSPGEPTS